MAGVTIDVDNVKSKFQRARLNRAQYVGAQQAKLMMEKYVPLSLGNKQGHLRDVAHVTDDGSIHYTLKHARAQYYGFGPNGVRFRKYTTPGTGRRWDLMMKANKGDMASVRRAMAKDLL